MQPAALHRGGGGSSVAPSGPRSVSVAASGTAATPSLGGFEDNNNGDGSFFLTVGLCTLNSFDP
jgi:hypothetical protein